VANTTSVAAVRLAVASGKRLQLVEVTPAGDTVLRTATLPGPIGMLAWASDDPIALVQRPPDDSCGIAEEMAGDHAGANAARRACKDDAVHDGLVGRLTANGFVPFARPPESTWSLLTQPKDAAPCTTECWSLEASATEVWVGHCKWVFSADGRDHCHEWAYVRLDKPGPATKTDPPTSTSSYELPTVAASRRVEISFESVTPPPAYDGDEPEAKQQLHCALDGKPVAQYPEPKELDAGMSRDVTWLATSPPIFAAFHNHDGFEMTSELVVFERCKRTSVRKLIAGPDGLVALVGDSLDVRRNGALVGSTSSGSLIVFAPR
jgi:hypothetical protein